MLIDTHCHLNFKNFKEDADEVIKRTLKAGVRLVNVGSEFKTSRRAIDYAEKCEDGVWAAIGLHPIHLFSSAKVSPEENCVETFDYEKYLKLAQNKKVVAIGEVGLDYHHFDEDADKDEILEIKKEQKKVFKEFIRLANEANKPIIVHCWDAYDDLLKILQENPVKKKGIIHSFIGSHKTAKKFIELGFKIGLNGIITYSESYDKLIREIGLENIVLETDAPYLTPAPLERHSRNEPLNVKYVAQKIADVLQIDIEKVKTTTTQNAEELFGV